MGPQAEVLIDDALVASLLAAQHPDLAGLPRSFVGEGWDNVMVVLGDSLVARLPRRAMSVDSIAAELRWLPELAPRLPLPVPVPLRAGGPGEGFPWPWAISRWLPGRCAALDPPRDMLAAGRALGEFLTALHRPAPDDAPVNEYRGVPLGGRVELFQQHMTNARLGNRLGRDARSAVLRLWAEALEVTPYAGPPVWVHGDLHGANVLTNAGAISGVIDFGDLTSGDPAVDLICAWVVLDAAGRGALREAYPVADDLWMRGRGWAAAVSVAVLAGTDDPLVVGMGDRAIRELLASR